MRNRRLMQFNASTVPLFLAAARLLATGCADNAAPGDPSGSGEPGHGALLILGSTVNANDALCRFSLDGTESKVLAKAVGSTAWLSANGSRIAARRTWDGLIFWDPNGDHVATLDIPNKMQGQWAPDGQTFALLQPINNNFDRQLWLVDTHGMMSRDIVDDIDVFNPGCSPTNHFVYLKMDDAIKSVQLSGATLDLAAATRFGGARTVYRRNT